jgi:hypothetical protein
MSYASEKFGMKLKPGYLAVVDEGVSESLAVEVYGHGPWSVDLVATEERFGGGVARDLWRGVDLGIYGTTRYDEWNPKLGLGLHWGW